MEEIGLVHTKETPGRIFKVHSAPRDAGNGAIFMPRDALWWRMMVVTLGEGSYCMKAG